MTCQEPGCKEPEWKHGWCKPHGNEEINAYPYDPVLEGRCTYDDCDRPLRIKGRGVCAMHDKYERFGWPSPVEPIAPRGQRCSKSQCTRPKIARGLCSKHYQIWRKSQRHCAIPDCPGGVLSRGWCGTHYGHWRKYGDPLKVGVRGWPRGRLCGAPNCDHPHVSKGYCAAHYRRWLRGDSLDVPLTRLGLRLCSVVGCGRRHAAKGLCVRHYNSLRQYGDPLVATVLEMRYCLACGSALQTIAKGPRKYCGYVCKKRYYRGQRAEAAA